MPATTMRVPMTGKATRLPEYHRQMGAVEAQASARLDDSAAGIALKYAKDGDPYWRDMARAMGQISKATEAVGDVYFAYNQTRARDAYNQYQNEAMQKQAELNTLQGQNALGPDGVQAQLTAWQTEAKERLGQNLSGYAKQLFDKACMDTDAKSNSWATGKVDREFNAYQDTVDAGTMLNAQQLAAQDTARIPEALGAIKYAMENKARRNGWDADYSNGMMQKESEKLLTSVINDKIVGKDFASAGALLSAYGATLTPELRNRLQEARGQAFFDHVAGLVALGKTDEARQAIMGQAAFGATGGNIYAGMNSEGVGAISAKFESGPEGSMAIGYDSTGGTSYGRYQIAAKKGGMPKFLQMLEASGPEGKAAAERLRNAGPADTGSKKGAFPEQWKAEVAANPKLMEDVQHKYIEQTHYVPALKGLDSKLQTMITNSGPLQEMLWSTAVQHGGAGARGIINKVYKEGMSPALLLEAVYNERATRFPSSSPEVRESVQNRLRNEKGMLLGALGQPQQASQTGTANTPYTERATDQAPETLSSLTTPFTETVSDSQPEAQTTQTAQGKKFEPNFDIGSPGLNARFRKLWKDMDKMDSQQRVEDISKDVFDKTKGLYGEERMAAAMQAINSMTVDPAERESILKVIDGQFKYDDDARNAEIGSMARQAVEAGKKDKLSPLEFMQRVNANENMSQEAKELAIQKYNGKIEDTPQTRFALDELYRQIDANPEMTVDQIEAYGVEHRMTDEQIKSARKYLEKGGKLQGLNMSRVEGLLKEINNGQKKDMPDGLYDEVVKRCVDGKIPNDKDLRKIIANLLMNGESENTSWYVPGYGDNENYLEAVRNKRGDKWLPNIESSEERKQIEASIRANLDNISDEEKRGNILKILNGKNQEAKDQLARSYKKEIIMGIKG